MSENNLPNIPSSQHIDDDKSHSDSDSQLKVEHTSPLVKSEKKKQLPSNFGRPRKHPYKPGKYKCVYCETMCSKPSVLTKHMRAHTNERPFPCSICKRSFKTKSNLSKHEKSKSHSTKLGEIPEYKPSTKEKVDQMLQALSGLGTSQPRIVPKSLMEFDSIEKKKSVTESDHSSPTSSEEKSIFSDENCISDSIKKEKYSADNVAGSVGDISEINETSSSCSGMLTINSQGGPITVEVQINLETMRHLQQGITNMTNKKNSPSSPLTPTTSRNDAELRAAESILHMANQRPNSFETFEPKSDSRKNGTTIRKPQGTLSPLSRKSPDYPNLVKTVFQNTPQNPLKTLLSKDSGSNRSTPMEEGNPINLKIKTKCLVKENLLKKMKRKQVQETNHLPSLDVTVSSIISPHNNATGSCNKSIVEKVSEVNLSSPVIRPSNLIYNPSIISINKTDNILKNLISDSKSTAVLSIQPNKGKPGVFYQKSHILSPNPQILNCITTTCNSQTLVLVAQANNSIRTQIPESKSMSTLITGSISESKKLNLDTDVLSKVITNTQSLHQHQGNKSSNQNNLSTTNTITTSLVAISSACVESPEESDHQLLKNEHVATADDTNQITYQKQSSSQATQESETESSPRLCIVEEPLVQESYSFVKKSSESDEEIDVVNTDSDDDRLPLQKNSDVGFSESSAKRRRLTSEDNDLVQKDTKVEKCVHLHAPNINAKDLMQDCPLNLSANRQPTIPPVSQIPVSVLQNLYQTISPPNVTLSASNNSSNTPESDSNINVLTNKNPAHPQSLQKFSSVIAPLSSNGHHRDYPIFDDKLCCDVCLQMIEPSMLALHKNMHIYTDTKDSHPHGNNNSKSGSSVTSVDAACSPTTKIPFNKPRTYKCVVCNIAFRVIGHLRKHHKSKSHLLGLVNSGLLSKALYSKIEQSKVPIQEVIDQKTGNIIPDVLSRYISNWSQANTDSDPH